MMTAIHYALGEIIVPRDGALHNDLADTARLLSGLDEGQDSVSGWRQERKDAPLKLNLPSSIANRLISGIFGVHPHDDGCPLKAYRRGDIKDIKLYGEMRRFAPIYATWQAARVTEVPAARHPRMHGQAKCGPDQIVMVVLDPVWAKLLSPHANTPVYVFGGFDPLFVVIAITTVLTADCLKVAQGISFILTPLALLAVTAPQTSAKFGPRNRSGSGQLQRQ